MLKKILQKNITFDIKSGYVYILIIIAVGLAVYSNSLYNGFLWDDYDVVVNDQSIHSWKNLPKIFTGCMGSGPIEKRYVDQSGFYRPIQTATYIIDFALWGLNAGGFHLASILWHILAAISVYFLVSILFRDRLTAFFTALLFVVFPTNTEAVDFISGRADSLALLFTLLTFVFYIKQPEDKRRSFYILMSITYALALFSKENSLILIAILPVYHYIFRRRFTFVSFSILACMALSYMLLRIFVIPHPSAGLLGFDFIIERIPGFFVALTNYIGLLLFPINLHMDYGQILFYFGDLKAMLGIALMAGLLFYAFRKSKSDKLLSFSICWFFITFLPVSNIFYLLPYYMAEHYLYVPAIGFFLILGRGLNSLYGFKKHSLPIKVFIISLFIAYASITVRQNDFWVDGMALYGKTLKCNPDSLMANVNLGSEYLFSNKYDDAIKYFRKAAMLLPSAPIIYYDMGNAYTCKGDIQRSLGYYEKAVAINPKYMTAYIGITKNLIKEGKNKECIKWCEKALAINPRYIPMHDSVARAYFNEKQYDLAIKHYDQAISLGLTPDPNFLEQLRPHRRKAN